MPVRGMQGVLPLSVQTVTVAGTSQSDATLIHRHWSPGLILAAGDDLAGLRLPMATKGARYYYVKNTGLTQLSILKVYPPTDAQINSLGTNVVLNMAPGAAAIFVAASRSQWYTFSLLPS